MEHDGFAKSKFGYAGRPKCRVSRNNSTHDEYDISSNGLNLPIIVFPTKLIY